MKIKGFLARGKHPIETFMKKRIDMTQALPPLLSPKELSPLKNYHRHQQMSDLNNYVKNLDMRLYLEAYNQGKPNMPLNMD
jgi:hypothetical protein